MSSCAIVCAGEFPRKPYPLYLLGNCDRIVCCDSALATWLRVSPRHFGGRMPDLVIGDMDSVTASALHRYGGPAVHVEEQDDNDQTKAVRYVLENFPDVSEIHIFGAGGKREDHTVGNLGLLMEYARMFGCTGIGGRVTIDAVSDYSTAFAITGNCELTVGKGRSISIFSPDNSLSIRSEGLEWQTEEVVFDNWWKATLNRATDDTVKLFFSHTSLALIVLP